MKRHIALVAHNNCKTKLINWTGENKQELKNHKLYATGTTGALLETHLNLPIEKFESGPLGGDMQIGSRITEGLINCLIFFWDPLTSHPHIDDTKALLRIATLWNIPVACNEASADFLISSPLFNRIYENKKSLVHLNTQLNSAGCQA